MSASIHYLRPFHEARLDDIPLIWKLPEDTPQGIVIHIPDFGQRKEDVVRVLDLITASGRVAVTLDLAAHGARAAKPVDKGDAISARVIWSITGETVFDIPTVATWARLRFGDLPLSLEGVGMGGDIALAAARLVGDFDQVTVIGGSPDWGVPMTDLAFQRVPDSRAILLRQMLEPTRYASDYSGMRLHFVTLGDGPRLQAVDAFKSEVLSAATGEGGQIVTTALRATAPDITLTDAAVWWPHLGLSRAA